MILGIMLHTAHMGPAQCDNTAGIYAVRDQIGGGIFRNSECNLGAWGGWAPETNTITLRQVEAKAGAIIGVVAGYRSRPVSPLFSPSIAVSFDGNSWVRANYLPSYRGSTSGVMFSIEWKF